MENFNNKISRLELENFTCFAKAEMDFSSGINVFIGENGTGKTHILKALYAMIYRSQNMDYLERSFNGDAKRLAVADNFQTFYKSAKMGEELMKDSAKTLIVKISLENTVATYSYKKITDIDNEAAYSTNPNIDYFGKINGLFIPVFEMISSFNGFISGYEKRENSFDYSYYLLAKAIDLLALKKQNGAIIETLTNAINGFVVRDNNEFFIQFNDEKKLFHTANVAAGINKLAQMIYLVQNGSLNKDTILFWDEPETNLNPKYIKIVAKFLQVLAKNGVQIFVATHDYLLTYLLSLSAEYPKKDTPPMRFFSLSKGENGTEIEFADTIHGLTNNAILDEYSAYGELMLNAQIEKLQTV